MLGNRAHEGLQSPSNLEERKGLKEAQHAAHILSAAHPHPPSNPRVDLRLARGLPAEALDCASASLEGSEPTLGGADRLRLARG